MYISSKRDFSQADKRSDAAHEMRAFVEGHEKRRRFDPAVLRVRTFVYRLGPEVGVAGTVTEPRT